LSLQQNIGLYVKVYMIFHAIPPGIFRTVIKRLTILRGRNPPVSERSSHREDS